MQQIRALLFDFYNTLGTGRLPDECVAADVLTEFGFDLDRETVRAAEATASGWLDGPDWIDHSAHSRSAAHYREYLRGLHAPWLLELGVDPLPDGFFERLVEAWDDPARIVLFDDTLPVLTRLRDAGYVLGVVSNWSWGLQDVLDLTGVAPLLDLSVISARTGYRKPHPEIYAAALRALRLPPDAVLFVGDSPHADVAGPIAAGMTPVHIDRFERHPVADGVPRIKRLAELFDLLPERAPAGAARGMGSPEAGRVP